MIAPPPTHTSAADLDGLGELLLAAQFGVQRVRGGVDLDRWAEQREVADLRTRHTSRTTQLKLKKHALAEQDVRAVVAEERRLQPDGIAAAGRTVASGSRGARPGPARGSHSSPGTDPGLCSRARTSSGSSGSYSSPASILSLFRFASGPPAPWESSMRRQPDLDAVPGSDLQQLVNLGLRGRWRGRDALGDRHAKLEEHPL
jgi:hypothetical protein